MHNLRPIQILVPQLGGFKLPFLSVGVLASIFILPCALLVKGDTSEYPTDSSLQSLHHLANVVHAGAPRQNAPSFKITLMIFTDFIFALLG